MEIDSPTQEINVNMSQPGVCDAPGCKGHSAPPLSDVYAIGVRAVEFADDSGGEIFSRLSAGISYAECISVVWLTVEVELEHVPAITAFFAGFCNPEDVSLGPVNANDTLDYEHLHAPEGSAHHYVAVAARQHAAEAAEAAGRSCR